MSIERLNFSTESQYNCLESSIHVARYMIAKEFVKGKRILDIACGEGYGSFLLHQWGASKVTGVDISADAIQNAKMNFSHEDIEFICSNAENIIFEEKYNVIISLETIEHVNDESQYLNVLKNALTDDGILIVSCPNDHWYYTENESNEYHLRKYTFDDFILASESVLGKAKHWLLGTNVFGYGNFVIDPITKKLQCDKEFLEMKDIVNQENTNCLASYSEQKHLPSEKESLYYVGIWSNNPLISNSNNGINIFPVAPAHFDRLSLDWVYIIQNRVNELEESREILLRDNDELRAYIRSLELKNSASYLELDICKENVWKFRNKLNELEAEKELMLIAYNRYNKIKSYMPIWLRKLLKKLK